MVFIYASGCLRGRRGVAEGAGDQTSGGPALAVAGEGPELPRHLPQARHRAREAGWRAGTWLPRHL